MESLAAEVVFPGRGSSPTPSEHGGAAAVCALCLSAPGKYTCPRCNAPYCSLPCYKGARHAACSELFYRDSVLQALREQDGGGRAQVQEMLLRLKREEEEGVTDEEGGKALWDRLSRQEKEHFNSLLRSGHIGSLVPRWTPWWQVSRKITELRGAERERCHGDVPPGCSIKPRTCPAGNYAPLTHRSSNQDVIVIPEQVPIAPKKADDGQKLSSAGDGQKEDSLKIASKKRDVKECLSAKPGRSESNSSEIDVEETLQDDQSVASQIPPLLRSIPLLCALTRNPSPLGRFTLVNVLYSYSFSLLRHNGDLSDEDDLLEFIRTLLSVSGALSTMAVFSSTAHALKSAIRAATDPLLGGDEGVAVLALEATAKILLGDGGNRYCLAALSHLYRLLGKVHKLVTGEKQVKKGAFNAKKKCLFLAAWVKENRDCLAVLAAEVMVEYELYLKDLNEVAELSQGLQRAWGGKLPPAKKKLIEEVN